MRARVVKFIEPVHMGLGHEGLTEFLRVHTKTDIEKMPEGALVMCMNRSGDKLKVFGGKGLILGYLRMPKGQRIMKDALQFLPRTFGAAGFDYEAACKEAIAHRLKGGVRVPKAAAKAADNLLVAG